MMQALTISFLLLGSLLMLLGAVGVCRMPDVFTRMQTATKPLILGVGSLAAAVSLHFGDPWVTARAFLIVAFFFLTGPIAAHAIARAAYLAGTRLWEGTVIDELQGKYDRKTGELASTEPRKTPG